MIITPFKYCKIHLLNEPATSSFRVGGCAPAGVRPQIHTGTTKFFMTIPLSSFNELSIFYDFNYSSKQNPVDQRFRLVNGADATIQYVLHDLSNSCVGGVPSEISCHALCADKHAVEESDTPYEHHKLGGRPTFSVVVPDNIMRTLSRVESQGFKHYLQLAFPVLPEDGIVQGNWPFCEYTFHIFIREQGGFTEACFIWG